MDIVCFHERFGVIHFQGLPPSLLEGQQLLRQPQPQPLLLLLVRVVLGDPHLPSSQDRDLHLSQARHLQLLPQSLLHLRMVGVVFLI